MDERFIEIAQEREERRCAEGVAAIVGRAREEPLIIDGVVCCRGCEEAIPPERLQAAPEAVRCIECQVRRDKQQGMYARR